jgi:Protein of unknown function (DUF2798)
MSNSSQTFAGKRPVYKLPARHAPFAFAFFMAGIMAFLMCLVIVGANTGLTSGYILRVLHTYMLAMPTAFVCVLLVRPLVVRLVALVVYTPGRPGA